jgi:hypothetical protein
VSVLGGEDDPPTPRDLLRAFRYPDRSVVIDLSHLKQDAKFDYIRSVLPAVNTMRRRTGLPHRILLDEAHYFLHDPGAHRLLDLQTNGYTIVTYCASRLPPELLAATEVMIVTCESSPGEIEALCRCCARCKDVDHSGWRNLLGHLEIGQAALLPITEEAGGAIKLFTIGARLTPHVRHRQKYCDVPVTEGRAFVFSTGGQPPYSKARTLRDFVQELEWRSVESLDGYLRRGDFSRWIGDVFGDHALAAELRALEEQYQQGLDGDATADIANAIRGRYDLTEEEDATAASPPADVKAA